MCLDKEEFLLYSGLPRFKKNVEKSKNIIKEFLSICPESYLAWSTGKDSTCVRHLLSIINPNIPSIHFDLGVEYPSTYEYKKLFPDTITFKPEIGIIDKLQKYGFDTKEAATHCKKPAFINEFKNELLKYKGFFMGLRYDESRARSYLRKRGSIYQKKDGNWICNPISFWKFHDVFAYLYSNEIPIHPHYTMKNSSQPVKERRVSGFLAGRNRAANFGRFFWFSRQYPDIFKEMCFIFPGLKQYI